MLQTSESKAALAIGLIATVISEMFYWKKASTRTRFVWLRIYTFLYAILWSYESECLALGGCDVYAWIRLVFTAMSFLFLILFASMASSISDFKLTSLFNAPVSEKFKSHPRKGPSGSHINMHKSESGSHSRKSPSGHGKRHH
jgi:hypothetical protein